MDDDFFQVDSATGEIIIPNAIENNPSQDGDAIFTLDVEVTVGAFTNLVTVEYLIAGGAS